MSFNESSRHQPARSPSSPPREHGVWLEDLSKRVACGDPHALDQLARHLLPILTRRLRHAHRHAPSDCVWDACVDAILDYWSRPDSFDPGRGVPLDRYLQLAASRNLADLLKADARRQRREATYVTLQWLRGWQPSLDDGDEAEARRRVLSTVDEGPERDAFALWLAGERRTGTLAAALGLSHLRESDKCREVKRFKDRARQRRDRLLRRIKTGSG